MYVCTTYSTQVWTSAAYTYLIFLNGVVQLLLWKNRYGGITLTAYPGTIKRNNTHCAALSDMWRVFTYTYFERQVYAIYVTCCDREIGPSC